MQHQRWIQSSAFALTLLFAACAKPTWAGRIIEESLETNLVPSPAQIAVLLPDGYENSGKTYPLLVWLHGGGGDLNFLKNQAAGFQERWDSKAAPEMVVVTPNAGRSFYMDYKDSSQKWETFIVTQLLDHMRKTYRVTKDPKLTFIGGISMGGMGSLRMGLKYLDKFGAIAAMEPGIEPTFAYKDIKLEDRFWRSQELFEEKYGKPVDEAYWAANNPATIVRDNPARVRESGIAIYIEVGTEDAFGLDRGTEFLHRVLYDNGIRHEYRYVLGADHVGATMGPRIADAMAFLNKVVNPPGPDPQVEALKRQIQTWKRQAGLNE